MQSFNLKRGLFTNSSEKDFVGGVGRGKEEVIMKFFCENKFFAAIFTTATKFFTRQKQVTTLMTKPVSHQIAAVLYLLR